MRLPEVGTMFQSRYRLDAILGAGGFATVYRAADTAADRTVALKVLKPELTGYPPDVRSRFDREVQIVANLRDEHTITLFDFGTSRDGLLFMVTEFVPGEDLSELLKRRGRLEPAEVVHILSQVLYSLREAHAAGLLHRDIKPANIRLFEYAGDPLCVRVLDFGIAKRMGNDVAGITKDGAIIGTPRYMSPEQLLQGELTPSSDIYSLGVVAFELLMGSQAIHGTQLADQLQRLATGHVFSIPELQRIGPGLCRILDRMAARDPRARFRSADEAIGALNALQGRPVGLGSSDMIPVAHAHHTPSHLMPPPARAPNHTPASLRPPPGAYPTAGSHEMPRRPVPRTDPAVPIQRDDGRRTALIVGGGLAVLCIGAATVALIAGAGSTSEPAPAAKKSTNPLVRNAAKPSAPVAENLAPKTTVEVYLPDSGGEERTRSFGCGRSAPLSGFGMLRTTIGLSMRSTAAYVPSNYDPTRAYPLIVMMHTDAETAGEFLKYSKMDEIAEAEGAILIAPNGGGMYAWQNEGFTDGIGIANQAIDDARSELCVDLDQIFVIGHGAGGKVVERVPCRTGGIRAIATSSFRGQPRDGNACSSILQPLPYIHIAPLKDKYNPIEGGQGCSGVKKVSLEEKEERWRELNHCTGNRKVWHRAPEGVCYTWDCEVPFVSCHVDAGRNWNGFPGKRVWDTKDCDGPSTDFPYPQTIWKFFRQTGSD